MPEQYGMNMKDRYRRWNTLKGSNACMDIGRYDSMEGISRVESGMEAESSAGAITELRSLINIAFSSCSL